MENFSEMLDAGKYLPAHVVPWITWMQVVLFAAPLAFLRQAAARWLIVSQLGNTLVAFSVFVLEGNQVTRLFGLGHLLWIFPLILLLNDLRSDKNSIYRIFAGLAAVTIAISLVFDVRDIALWTIGDRSSVLEYDATE